MNTGIREPKMRDLIEFVCMIQPELDQAAAQRLLCADDEIRGWIGAWWANYRELRESLLNCHLLLDEKASLS